MAIRFKEVEYCAAWEGTSQGGQECSRWEHEQIPIKEWDVYPSTIFPAPYTLGQPMPNSQQISIEFPELWEWVERKSDNVVFSIELAYSTQNVQWLSLDATNLAGLDFTTINLSKASLNLNFVNLSALSPGIHSATVRLKAFWKKDSGNEFIEYSPRNIEVKLDVRSSGNLPPDVPQPLPIPAVEPMHIVYNKITRSLTGDTVRQLSEMITIQAVNSAPGFVDVTHEARIITVSPNVRTAQLGTGQISDIIVLNCLVNGQNHQIQVMLYIDVHEGTGVDFSVMPSQHFFTIAKTSGDVVSGKSTINNVSGINIEVLLKPTFINSATVEGNHLSFSSVNVSTLQVGNHYGDIVLVGRNSQGVKSRRRVTIGLNVTEPLKSDFKNNPYFFALDPNKVVLSKTNSSASYVKVTLEMVYQAYEEIHRETQEYIYPYYDNRIEFYPGEEVQDFFIRMKEMMPIIPVQQEYRFAVVNILVKDYDSNDVELSSARIDRVIFAAGKKPKCFPIFTDFPKRRTFTNSKIRMSADALQDRFSSWGIEFSSRQLGVFAFNLERSELGDVDKKMDVNGIELVPFPEPDGGKIIDVFFENQNMVLEWFSCPAQYQKKYDFKHIVNETNGNKYGSLETESIFMNTGWVLKEEIPLINALIKSRICFIIINGQIIKARPMSKKNEMYDTANNLYSMDLEFNIKQDER